MNTREKKELALSKFLLIGLGLVGLGVVIWLAWARPAYKAAKVNSFADCKAAGYPIQESYPEVCVGSDGKQFTNPDQQAPTLPNEDQAMFLNITEWGVRLKLTNANQDGQYLVKADRPGTAYLSLTSLKDTDCAVDKITVGAIVRFTAQDKDATRDNTPLAELYPDATKVGDYYYSFSSPQAACSDDQTVLDKAEQARLAFKASLAEVQAIPTQ